MQDYLTVKGQIDSTNTEIPPEAYKPNEWQKLDKMSVTRETDLVLWVWPS